MKDKEKELGLSSIDIILEDTIFVKLIDPTPRNKAGIELQGNQLDNLLRSTPKKANMYAYHPFLAEIFLIDETANKNCRGKLNQGDIVLVRSSVFINYYNNRLDYVHIDNNQYLRIMSNDIIAKYQDPKHYKEEIKYLND